MVKTPAGDGERRAGGGRDPYEGFVERAFTPIALPIWKRVGCDSHHNPSSGAKLRRHQLATRMFKKAFFVMAITPWPDICDGHHCGADRCAYCKDARDKKFPVEIPGSAWRKEHV
jgi:hypothetical protein